MSEQQPASRPINLHLRPKSAMAHAVYDRLDRIQVEVEEAEAQRRARDSTSAGRFRSCLRALCLDLDAAYRHDPEMVIGVRRDTSALGKNPAYPVFVTARPFLEALKGLIAIGYIQYVSTGSEASGRSSRVRGTAKLRKALHIGEHSVPELEDHSDLIRLKLGKKKIKKRVRIVEDDNTHQWRRNLERINQTNASYTIGIELSASDWDKVEAERRASAVSKAESEREPFDYERINFTQTRLFRSFSSRDWSQGGRFYGGWWHSVPKEYRKHITINDKATCEYDFSALHLRLLYARAEVPVPNPLSPYDMPYGERGRDAVKAAFNIMLNTKEPPRPELVPDFSATRMNMSWRIFLQGIREHHSCIKHFFNTEVGTALQRTDADIAEAVLLQFTTMQQPCLPVHDSFITYANLADEVEGITSQAALAIAGVALPAKQKHLAVLSGANGLVTTDISEILDRMGTIRPLR